MIRALGLMLALMFVAVPRAGSAFPTAATPVSTDGGATSASRPSIGTTRGSAVDAAQLATTDSSSFVVASPSGLYAPVLGGLVLKERRSPAPFMVAGLAIGAIAAPAVLFAGDRHHGDPATSIGSGFRSVPPPIHIPTPGEGLSDPPALDVLPATQSSGPDCPSPAPAIPEPPAAALLVAGFLALSAAMSRRH